MVQKRAGGREEDGRGSAGGGRPGGQLCSLWQLEGKKDQASPCEESREVATRLVAGDRAGVKGVCMHKRGWAADLVEAATQKLRQKRSI